MAKVFFGFDDALSSGRHETEYDRSRLSIGIGMGPPIGIQRGL
jgi:hypothetical protein